MFHVILHHGLRPHVLHRVLHTEELGTHNNHHRSSQGNAGGGNLYMILKGIYRPSPYPFHSVWCVNILRYSSHFVLICWFLTLFFIMLNFCWIHPNERAHYLFQQYRSEYIDKRMLMSHLWYCDWENLRGQYPFISLILLINFRKFGIEMMFFSSQVVCYVMFPESVCNLPWHDHWRRLHL